MSYGQFLMLFLVVPLIVVLFISHRHVPRSLFVILACVSLVAVVYTGPWDSAIIANGVWSYGPGQVIGWLVARVPLEEYGFYVLQTFLVGTLAAYFLAREQR